VTGEQIYNQIVLKSRLIAQRELRQFMAGEIEILPCSGDRERRMIIEELDQQQTR
jgi:hypothetical protein